MELLTVVLFSLAVSADGFMVGLAYGIKKIKIPVVSLIVISLASALAVTSSMICGKAIGCLLTEHLASLIGAGVLVVIGMFFMLQYCRDKINSLTVDTEEPILSLNIKSLGIIINILKEPSTADFDCSGEISPREAFFLGIALAMDAFGAGIGIAMAGFHILLTAVCVGVLKFILVNTGLSLGKIVECQQLKSYSAQITGFILVLIGITELI